MNINEYKCKSKIEAAKTKLQEKEEEDEREASKREKKLRKTSWKIPLSILYQKNEQGLSDKRLSAFDLTLPKKQRE